FAYNMAHLMNKNYEFLHYFDAMMEHSSFTTNYADKSFVLCDGFQTFGYEDGDTMNFFSNMNSQNFQNPYIYTTKAGYINYGTSQAPILDLLESSGPYHVQYMPVNGRSTNYRFYLYNMMNRIMNSNITWHWESFPIMQSNPIPIASFTNTTKSYWQNTLSRPTDNYWYRDPSNNIWIRSGSYTFNFTNGHKLYVPTGISLQNEEIGNVIPQTSTVNISSGVKEWVGYWLMENQSLAQALGSHLSKVANVYGESWQYQDQSGNTKLDPAIIPTMNANSLIMEFGKMYIIELKQGESISNFTWQKGRINGSKNQCTQYPNYNYTKHFSYVQQANYETIMIDNIDETSGYEEIAVYAGNDCIGASKVTSSPVQILIYSQNYEGHVLSFRAVTNDKKEQEISLQAEVIGLKNNVSLIAGQIGYTGIKLYRNNNTHSAIIEDILNCRAYPNPCNPSTNIQFSIDKSSDIQIDIYNIKGQKVKQLLNQHLSAGTHSIVWTGLNEEGKTVSNGVYYFRISNLMMSKTGKILILK
ncbi:MAG TPA: FlgD immunoglobulin-like domain containing protein, partial [Candidatus Cloacimonadota bacterium]|nr:FlgD immunoglobulin-like domain containing protein [Candidatus Cloacimonadota bacterium]